MTQPSEPATGTKPEKDQKQLLYFADPMCSWCWGFSPVISAIADTHGSKLPIRPMMGGLRPGTRETMSEQAKEEIRDHWDHVRRATGQEFDFDFFERDDFVYDTEPPCRAVVAARAHGADKGMAMLARLHRAFYAENRDITKTDVVMDLAVEQGLEREPFAELYQSDAAKNATEADFHVAHRLGIRGFPSLLAGTENEGFALVTTGYQPHESLAGPIAEWLELKTSTES